MKQRVSQILVFSLQSRGKDGEMKHRMRRLLGTSFASGPRILFRSSLSRTDWKIADETATPLTYAERWFKKSSMARATART